MPQRICLTRPGEFILEYRTVCRLFLRQLFSFSFFFFLHRVVFQKDYIAINITFYRRDLKRRDNGFGEICLCIVLRVVLLFSRSVNAQNNASCARAAAAKGKKSETSDARGLVDLRSVQLNNVAKLRCSREVHSPRWTFRVDISPD